MNIAITTTQTVAVNVDQSVIRDSSMMSIIKHVGRSVKVSFFNISDTITFYVNDYISGTEFHIEYN